MPSGGPALVLELEAALPVDDVEERGQLRLALVVMQPGMAEARRRMPADRLAAIGAVGDVERAVDQRGEPRRIARQLDQLYRETLGLPAREIESVEETVAAGAGLR